LIDLHNIAAATKIDIMTSSSHHTSSQKTMTAEKRITACKALLNLKRAFPDKQAKYQKDRTARNVDRYEKTDVDESSSNVGESQVQNTSKHDRFGSIRNGSQDLPHVLPPIAGSKITMSNMYFTSRHSGYTRPVHETCSESSVSSEESEQLLHSPLTSDASEDMMYPTPPGTGNTSRTERIRDQMVLVERAPEPLPSRQSIPLRPSPPRNHHPMSPAPVLFRPVLIPGALHPINARSGQVLAARDTNRYIFVHARNYERMSNAMLQQALQVIQAPANLRTKPKALQYLKSYFLAVRDRSHIIYVEKYKLSSAALVCD
jgi:hypothetical protein